MTHDHLQEPHYQGCPHSGGRLIVDVLQRILAMRPGGICRRHRSNEILSLPYWKTIPVCRRKESEEGGVRD